MIARFDCTYRPKKCREDVSAADDTIAIAHDDDLQLIEGVVCPSQNAGTYTRSKPYCTSLGNPDCGCSRELST
jgi:hypothetical protein